MEETLPRVNCVPCHIVEVRYEFPILLCDHCQRAAEAVDRAERTAIDLHLDYPTLLHNGQPPLLCYLQPLLSRPAAVSAPGCDLHQSGGDEGRKVGVRRRDG